MLSSISQPCAADLTSESEFCECAKDYCIMLQSQLHVLQCLHEAQGSKANQTVLADYSATLQHLMAASESLFRLARQEPVH